MFRKLSIHRAVVRMAAATAALVALAAFGTPSDANAQLPGCRRCVICTKFTPNDGHKFTTLVGVGEQGWKNNLHPDCRVGGCPGGVGTDPDHEPCVGGQALAASVKAADLALAGQVAGLAALVRRAGAAVEINYDRQALQVKGCDGGILAHVPLSSRQFAALAADRPRQLASR